MSSDGISRHNVAEITLYQRKLLHGMAKMISIALYQPDIPQNAGTILRLGACLGVCVHVIEPTGFVWSEKSLRRAGMDYLQQVKINRHDDFSAFLKMKGPSRLVLLTTDGDVGYTDFKFELSDILLVGRESAGVPDSVHAAAAARLKIPMIKGARSLNVATSAAMVAGEALRQTGSFPVLRDCV